MGRKMLPGVLPGGNVRSLEEVREGRTWGQSFLVTWLGSPDVWRAFLSALYPVDLQVPVILPWSVFWTHLVLSGLASALTAPISGLYVPPLSSSTGKEVAKLLTGPLGEQVSSLPLHLPASISSPWLCSSSVSDRLSQPRDGRFLGCPDVVV